MSEKLSFNNRVVVITGAGGGLGKVYALAYASRGARAVSYTHLDVYKRQSYASI